MHPEECLICVDMGTTRTRAWLIEGDELLARGANDFGLRDRTAKAEFHSLENRLRLLLHGIVPPERKAPQYILSAGMIGSPTGLLAVPHVIAPAGLGDISAAVQVGLLPQISELPLFVVPGVRTAGPGDGAAGIAQEDLMRGEETLCMGLLCSDRLHPGDVLLNLGSHWKWILIGDDGKIARSRTSLTGELVHAIQSHTLLASALPQDRPEAFGEDWLRRGAEVACEEGLTRALFCVRLLEQTQQTSPEERLSFLYGAVVEIEVVAILSSHFVRRPQRVLIAGVSPLSELWSGRLKGAGWNAEILSAAEIEQAYLAGLRTIVRQSPAWRQFFR